MQSAQPDKKIPIELPKNEEKLLRAPTFFEKYRWIKPVSILAILITTIILSSYLLKANTPQPTTISITPSPTISPQITTSNPTANWKTYYTPNFSFKYPADWEVKIVSPYLEIENAIQVIDLTLTSSSENTQYVIRLISYENPENLSLDKLNKKFTSSSRIGPGLSTEGAKLVKIYNGIIAYYFEKSICNTFICQSYILSVKDKVFQFINFHQQKNDIFSQILSTFKFLDSTEITPRLSCRPRPACLDSVPRCMIPETPDMCPAPTRQQVYCTQDVKQCPDGSFVGRTGPNCEFICPLNKISETEKNRIDVWIAKNQLNTYGDPKDTGYTGGTPLFDESTGQTKDRFEYILEKHIDKPWNK